MPHSPRPSLERPHADDQMVTSRETNPHAQVLGALRARVRDAVQVFRAGGSILVGDDGLRENEADLVFHAGAATPENVNAALVHARGLLCVSVSHDLADELGFPTAPRTPGDFAHTGFTLSVDAREGITSGISARDRALAIKLMAEEGTRARDFLSPGHIFPVRAHAGGLLARTGHTEALQELCTLANLAPAAAMCEVLADDGDALRPADLMGDGPRLSTGESATEQTRYLRALPYLSTVDLLWNRVLSVETGAGRFVRDQALAQSLRRTAEGGHAGSEGGFSPVAGKKWDAWRFGRGLEHDLSCETLVLLPEGLVTEDGTAAGTVGTAASLGAIFVLDPARVRIVITNGVSFFENSVAPKDAQIELRLVTSSALADSIDTNPDDYCDLSGKIGIGRTKCAVRRLVSSLRAVQFLASLPIVSKDETRLDARTLARSIAWPVPGDADFLDAALMD